jgi:hypothetical protein
MLRRIIWGSDAHFENCSLGVISGVIVRGAFQALSAARLTANGGLEGVEEAELRPAQLMSKGNHGAGREAVAAVMSCWAGLCSRCVR